MGSKLDLQGNNAELLEILGIAKNAEVAGTPYTGDNPLTIGKDGYTFPVRTLLKEGLEVVNEVSDEGEYLWERSIVQMQYKEVSASSTSVTVDNPDYDGTTNAATIYIANSYTIDINTGLYTLNNPTTQEIASGSTYTCTASNYMIVGSPSGLEMFRLYYSSTSSRRTSITNSGPKVTVKASNSSYPFSRYTVEGTPIITFKNYTVSSDADSHVKGEIGADGYWYDTAFKGCYIWNRFKYTDGVKGDWIEYVVSNNESEYPNGALHTDGYWYELSNTANLTVKTGTIFGVGSVNINTQLGKAPLYYGVSALEAVIGTDYSGNLYNNTGTVNVSASNDIIHVSFEKTGAYSYELKSLSLTWFAIG